MALTHEEIVEQKLTDILSSLSNIITALSTIQSKQDSAKTALDAVVTALTETGYTPSGPSTVPVIVSNS